MKKHTPKIHTCSDLMPALRRAYLAIDTRREEAHRNRATRSAYTGWQFARFLYTYMEGIESEIYTTADDAAFILAKAHTYYPKFAGLIR